MCVSVDFLQIFHSSMASQASPPPPTAAVHRASAPHWPDPLAALRPGADQVELGHRWSSRGATQVSTSPSKMETMGILTN